MLDDISILTQLIRKGDSKAFEKIFNTYYPGLCNYVNSFVGDIPVTEDLVQSLFIRIWEKRENLSPEKSLLALLFTSAKNAALNHMKHQRIEKEWKKKANERLTPDPGGSTTDIEMSQLLALIREALDKVPEKRRIIFIMSRYYGLSYKEIADILGISVKTIETQIGRTLRYLSDALSSYL